MQAFWWRRSWWYLGWKRCLSYRPRSQLLCDRVEFSASWKTRRWQSSCIGRYACEKCVCLFGPRFFLCVARDCQISRQISGLNSASEITYIVSGGAINSTHSLLTKCCKEKLIPLTCLSFVFVVLYKIRCLLSTPSTPCSSPLVCLVMRFPNTNFKLLINVNFLASL